MVAAASVFFASLAGLTLLFSIKALEAKRGRIFAPRLRTVADEAALSIKALLLQARVMLSRIPPALVLLSRIALHELALGAAKLARLAEKQSHRVADLVSHKRNFEKREPRSEFLKQMSERKNGDGQEDTPTP